MTHASEIPTLASLEFVPYLGDLGQLPEHLQGKVGGYAIFDQTQTLQYIGFSRNIYLSLKQHLIRQPDGCYWIKVHTVDRPNRTLLETLRTAWIAENGSTPPGNGSAEASWTEPIDTRARMTPEEQQRHTTAESELAQSKVLKQVARRIEAEILAVLQSRGVEIDLRFNPKLKDEGLLDLK